jgi:hypothetical protein
MGHYDVFNGDADGICALRQLRLADPVESILVTGLKREIALLRSVPAGEGDVVTVLDISLDRNREALGLLLARGAAVRYFDHHFAGHVPSHPRLFARIDERRAVCTSTLVDRHLRGRFRAWAVAGAFGDGLDESAAGLAATLDLDAERTAALRELGTSLNYAAYGETEDDLLVRPVELYRLASRYADPFELGAREPLVARLGEQRRSDLARAMGSRPLRETQSAAAWMLPDAPWARRVSGTFANRLALAAPHRAHAVITPCAGGAFRASVRAPRAGAVGAAELCRRFPGGGGRALAAGIDRLEPARLDEFLAAFSAAWAAPALPVAGP